MDEWPLPDGDLDDDEGPHRPLVSERLRRFGWLAMVLVPLMVLSLSQVAWSTEWALIVLVGGLALLSALRERHGGSGD